MTTCPKCNQPNIYPDPPNTVCADCGYEWSADSVAASPVADNDGPRVVRDANGVELKSGDSVVLIKSLKLKGATTLKQGSKATNIRIVNGDHEIDCRIDNVGVLLKAEFVKRV